MTCAVEGCEKEVHARGYCHTHYSRWWKGGDPHVPPSQPSYCHCGERAKGLGLCRNHYNKWARTRFSEKHTFPYRAWLPAEGKGRPVVHAQSWYTKGAITKLAATCNVRLTLSPLEATPDYRPCRMCLKIMKTHGFI